MWNSTHIEERTATILINMPILSKLINAHVLYTILRPQNCYRYIHKISTYFTAFSSSSCPFLAVFREEGKAHTGNDEYYNEQEPH